MTTLDKKALEAAKQAFYSTLADDDAILVAAITAYLHALASIPAQGVAEEMEVEITGIGRDGHTGKIKMLTIADDRYKTSERFVPASPSKRVERLEAVEDDNSDILKEVSSNFRAELDRIMADDHPPETGWLCEWLHATGPEWWTLGGEDGGYFAKDSLKALRFARKDDAQAYIDDAGWTEIVPTEHEWSDPPQALQRGRS